MCLTKPRKHTSINRRRYVLVPSCICPFASIIAMRKDVRHRLCQTSAAYLRELIEFTAFGPAKGVAHLVTVADSPDRCQWHLAVAHELEASGVVSFSCHHEQSLHRGVIQLCCDVRPSASIDPGVKHRHMPLPHPHPNAIPDQT